MCHTLQSTILLILHVIYNFQGISSKITDESYQNDVKCETYPVKQVIHIPGCENKTIMNNFCTGQCYSSWEPDVDGTFIRGIRHRKCRGCIPILRKQRIVSLNCERQTVKYIDVDIITVCKCRKFTCKGKGIYNYHDIYEDD